MLHYLENCFFKFTLHILFLWENFVQFNAGRQCSLDTCLLSIYVEKLENKLPRNEEINFNNFVIFKKKNIRGMGVNFMQT